MDERIGFGLYQSCGNRGTGGVLNVCLCLGCGDVGDVGWEWVCESCESGLFV